MALIIKGDMPSCCAVCCDCNSADDGNFCNRTGNRLGNDWQLYRPLNCPIIGEIPDSHGRLIDADELEKAVEKMVVCDSYEYTIAHEMVKKLLKIAPTVLEATT